MDEVLYCMIPVYTINLKKTETELILMKTKITDNKMVML